MNVRMYVYRLECSEVHYHEHHGLDWEKAQCLKIQTHWKWITHVLLISICVCRRVYQRNYREVHYYECHRPDWEKDFPEESQSLEMDYVHSSQLYECSYAYIQAWMQGSTLSGVSQAEVRDGQCQRNSKWLTTDYVQGRWWPRGNACGL